MGSFSSVRLPRRVEGADFIEIGRRVYIRSHSTLWALSRHEADVYTPSIVIEDDVYIGRYLYLSAIRGIYIGPGSVLSEHVYISDHSHGFDPEGGPILKQKLESRGAVKIGSDCFIGYRVTVMPGVILGDHSVVGAHSVVTHSFPAYSMVAGTPAKLLKRYCPQSKTWHAIGDLRHDEHRCPFNS